MAGIKTSNVVWSVPGSLGFTSFVLASNAKTETKNWAAILEANGYPVRVCDGTADEVQIQEMIDTLPTNGGTVRLSEGLFTIAASIVIDSFTKLLGSGITATQIKLANSANVDLISGYDIATSNTQTVEIAYLTIDGNAANNTAGNGIRLAPWNCELHDMTITGCSESGIQFIDNAGTQDTNRIYRCRIESCEDSGIDTGVPGTWIKDCYFSDITNSFVLGNGWQQIIHHNFFWSSPVAFATHINLTNCSYSQVTNNDFADLNLSNTWDINIYAAANTNDVLVSNNVIHSLTSLDAIRLEVVAGIDLKNVVISNNIIEVGSGATVTNGINMVGSTLANISIEGNVFAGTGTITNKIVANTGAKIHNNIGYTTENIGSATLLNGQTSVAFSHSLATTPNHVDISWKENPTNVIADWWWTADGATVTLNGVDPGASNLDFSWEAKV